ncbi:MAG: holo-ACP synthase [Atopobiaceae bacterium]|nr:holo-ACP synthase [Atopobiaceae bacterium]
MALAGIGVDIIEIARVERALERTPNIRRRIFTDEERAYCERTSRPGLHYAGRFAAREAVLKALGTGFSQGIGLKDVSVTRDENGRPQALLVGRAAEVAAEQGVLEIALSLSFTHDMAVANAVAVTEAARPRKDEVRDPEADLARSFKEARSVLDELERLEDGNEGATPDAPRDQKE